MGSIAAMAENWHASGILGSAMISAALLREPKLVTRPQVLENGQGVSASSIAHLAGSKETHQ